MAIRGEAFILYFCLSITILVAQLVSCRASNVGICYGRNADDLPTPDKVVQLVQKHNIKFVRIYDSNIQVLKAFANTGIELIIGVPNMDLLSFSQFQSNSETWLKNNILPYYPATRITHISVGSEVTEIPDNSSSLVVPAMNNVLQSLKKFGLSKKIKVSSVHSLSILSNSFPPSAGAFSSKHADLLKPMLEFLAENQSPFMIDIYPYFAFQDSKSKVSLEFALFESSSDVIDPNTGLLYTNLFDAQVDAVYYALMSLNYRTIKVMVTETGWPSKGSSNEKGASPKNAQTFNSNAIRHVINNTGTPAKPGEPLDLYIFSLFNENRKPGLVSERNWGLFSPDETGIYSVDFSGEIEVNSPKDSNFTIVNGTTWCIASNNASESDLKNALNWACSSGHVDCLAIQPSQPCFEPDTLVSHASYAFNSYFQQNGLSEIACGFGGNAIKVHNNPSYDKCLYLTNGSSNITLAKNTTEDLSSTSSVNSNFPTTITTSLVFLTILVRFV